VRYDQLGSAEYVDDVERSGSRNRLGYRREGGDPVNASFIRVDGDALEALVDEVAEHAERRPSFVRGRSDDRDPSRVPEQLLDLVVVRQCDRSAVLLQVEEVDRPLPRLAIGRALVPVRQLAPSFTYGRPTAAGGMLRPTTPARTMRVRR